MALLTINDTAPDFHAESTEGPIDFHDWIGDGWAVLFSHPRDFTPVCTTELGCMANIKPEFDKRGVKIAGLSTDPTGNHEEWARDIERTQGTAPNYPIISDNTHEVAKAYGMLPADVSGDPTDRTPTDNATLRNVFVIGPGQEDQAHPDLSDDHRPQLRRGAASDRLAPAHGEQEGRDPRPVEAGRRRDHRRLSLGRRREGALPGRLGDAAALHAGCEAAEVAVAELFGIRTTDTEDTADSQLLPVLGGAAGGRLYLGDPQPRL
jgi:alkyl hydroperoxide reductase subunit AhpC